MRNCKKELSIEDAYKVLDKIETAYNNLEDFVATVVKQERVNGKLMPREYIFMKFKKPYSIYLKWIGKVHKGREAIYVEGKNNDKIIAHEGGFFGIVTLSIDPYSSLAMWGNRHSIKEIGFRSILRHFKEDLDKADMLKPEGWKFYELGEFKIYGRNFLGFERISPIEGEDIFYSYKFHAYMDVETHLPLIIINWDFEKLLIEKYIFKEIKINVGLTEKDFDPKNKEYRF